MGVHMYFDIIMQGKRLIRVSTIIAIAKCVLDYYSRMWKETYLLFKNLVPSIS